MEASRLGRQLTCSMGPTINTQARPPTTHSTEVIANGNRKFPVRSRTNPVRAGPTTPAKLEKPFCAPYHLPTACGPASVWQNVKMPGDVIPQPMPAAISQGTYVCGPATAEPMIATAAVENPIAMANLRTKVGV